MGLCFRPLLRVSTRTFLLFFLVYCFSFTSTEGYDALDPNGNITIKWDVMNWTHDGYVAVVTIFNFQQYRHIPGWTLGWNWANKEVIWSMAGGETTEQGDCSRYRGHVPLPHCCKKDPSVVDLMPGAPPDQHIPHCCKGGVINSWGRDPTTATASFQLTVGAAGTTNQSAVLPRNFTIIPSRLGYTCGPAKIVKPTKFITPDGRRTTQALMTWIVTCTYSHFLTGQANPTCCVSLSSFYNDTIIPCSNCSCGCQSKPGSCVDPDSANISSIVSAHEKSNSSAPLVQCSSHMCQIGVHWHVKQNFEESWLVELSITNYNYRMNYSLWNLVVQHPSFDNSTQIFSFNYKPLNPYPDIINDYAMFYGVKFYNSVLMQAGPNGTVQSELLFRKGNSSFSFDNGWGFPTRVIFNDGHCVMPTSMDDAFP